MANIIQYSIDPFSLRPGAGTDGCQFVLDATSHAKALFVATTGTQYGTTPVFRVHPNYLTTPAMTIWFTCETATTGNAIFNVSVMAVSSGDTVDMDAESFDTTNQASVVISGSAGTPHVAVIALASNDSLAAGDFCKLRILCTGTAVAPHATTQAIEVIAMAFTVTGTT